LLRLSNARHTRVRLEPISGQVAADSNLFQGKYRKRQ
jgi:hypothetical protein